MSASLKYLHGAQGRSLFLLLLISCGFKLLVAWVAVDKPSGFMTSDSLTYIKPAEALLTHGVYSISPDRIGTPDTLRTPGYPVFIAGVYRLAGTRIVAIVMAQIAISLGTLILVFLLASELWHHPRTGLIATLLLTLDLASFTYTFWILSETLFTFLLMAALFCAVRFQRSAPRPEWCALFGVLFAASVLVRPIAYYLFGFLVFWVLLVCWQRRSTFRQSAGALAVFMIPFVLGVGGWRLRNDLHTDVPVLTRISGINLLFFRGAAIVALRDQIPFEDARRLLGHKRYAEIHPETSHLSPEKLSLRWEEEGLALIRAHPILFARTHLRPLAAILLSTPEHSLMSLLGLPVPSSGPLGDLLRLEFRGYVERWVVGRAFSWWGFVLLMAHLLLLLIGFALAWVRLLRSGRLTLSHGCLGLVFLYLLFISAGPEAYTRFRVPLAPILAIYAAAGLASANRPARNSSQKHND